MTAARSRWLVRLAGPGPDAAPAAMQLVCFPFAGGNAHAFGPLWRLLPDWIGVHGVQLPGRGMHTGLPPLTRLTDVVDALEVELAALPPGPYALYGASMGALVAFEYARAERRRGAEPPRCLFAVTARAPHLPDRGHRIHTLPSDDLARALRRYGGTPSAVLREPDLMDLILPVVRADFAIAETYVHTPEPALDVPIVAIGGRDDPFVPVSDLAEWSRQTTAGYHEAVLPGDHFFYRSPARQAEVADLITAVLAARLPAEATL